MRLKYLLLLLSFFVITGQAAEIPYHCDKDSIEINRILSELASQKSLNRGKRISLAAQSLVGKGLDNSLFTDSLLTLSLNLDSLTDMSLVNTAIALAIASEDVAPERSVGKTLSNVACRKGENSGFPSLFYHTSDWIGDNIYRGNFIELTDRYDGARSKTISLDYLTANSENIPAMKNPDTYDRIRMHEMGFRTHKVPFLPKQAISGKEISSDLRDGDIIVLVSDKNRSDFFTFGIVAIEADGPHLIHVDIREGKVIKEAEPLKRYFNLMTKYFNGFRWIRVN